MTVDVAGGICVSMFKYVCVYYICVFARVFRLIFTLILYKYMFFVSNRGALHQCVTSTKTHGALENWFASSVFVEDGIGSLSFWKCRCFSFRTIQTPNMLVLFHSYKTHQNT